MSLRIDPASVQNLNDQELHQYIMQQIAANENLTDPAASGPVDDPIGSRNVNAEAQSELKAAKSAAPAPTVPSATKAFSRSSDRSAANAIRLCLGSNPLTTRTHFGENSFIPDFSVLYEYINFMDRKMIATDKFTRTAEFWTPLVTRIYIAVLCYVQVFKAMRSAGRLDFETDQFLDWFELTFPSSTIPIPGPLINLIPTLSNAAVSATHYKSHAPRFPPTVPATPAQYYLLSNNAAPRMPNILLLLHQYFHHLTFAITGNPTARDVGRWSSFGRVFFASNYMAAPTGASHRTPLTTVHAHALHLFGSPGFRQPYLVNQTIGSNLLDYADEMLMLLPREISTLTDPTSTNSPNWREFLGFGSSHTWFSEFSRIMTDYCKFWKESSPYSEISPVGHTGALVRSTLPVVATRPTTRYPPFLSAYDHTVFSLALPESDELDGCLAIINTTVASDNVGLPMAGYINWTLHSGPYYALSIAKTGRDSNPLDGAGQILSDQYHVPNPKA
jgi:hypothetical protein